MSAFIDKVTEIYGAIAGLPADNSCFHDPALDLTWVEMSGGPYGGVYAGFGEVLENVFSRIGADWDDFKFTPSAFHTLDSVVTVEGDYTGVNRNTGKAVSARVIHLWKQAGGKILFEQFTDTALFWESMKV